MIYESIIQPWENAKISDLQVKKLALGIKSLKRSDKS